MRGNRAVVTSQRMEIRGDAKQLLNSVLPHEVTHTVLAHHFGRAVPLGRRRRSVLSENDEERSATTSAAANCSTPAAASFSARSSAWPTIRDMIVLYAQGYSITAFLVEKGGGGREGRAKLLQFLAGGMGNDWQPGVPQHYHGTPE